MNYKKAARRFSIGLWSIALVNVMLAIGIKIMSGSVPLITIASIIFTVAFAHVWDDIWR